MVCGLNKIATRETRGAISRNNSTHLPLREASILMNPVILPPGLWRLATKPLPTGSDTDAKTIGIVWVSCRNAAVTGVVTAKSTSGLVCTNSVANSLVRSILPLVQRVSTVTLRPSIHPSSASRFRNAASQAWPSKSVSATPKRTPMRRNRPDCCAREASGQATAAPPRNATNSRRFIARPQGSAEATL